jgi:hypothetical protein
LSAIVVYDCQGLLHALSRDILNGFHFSRDLELMRKQLDFFSTSLYPFLILFIQYVVFSTLVLVAPFRATSTRLLRIPTESNSTSNSIGFRFRHFRCKECYSLVLWIWHQNIAISTIVGTSSHITQLKNKQEGLHGRGRLIIFNTYLILPMHFKVCELEYHEWRGVFVTQFCIKGWQ